MDDKSEDQRIMTDRGVDEPMQKVHSALIDDRSED